MQQHKFWIDGREVSFSLEGETAFGEDIVMLDQDDDLTANALWHKMGYAVVPFLDSMTIESLKAGISHKIQGILEGVLEKGIEGFEMQHYHQFVDNEIHAVAISRIRHCFPIEELPVEVGLIEKRVGEVCGAKVTSMNPREDRAEFCIRIVRPNQKADNNPPHRDVYLDHLRNGINIYVPLAGSNVLSSLPLLPESHLLSERMIERTTSGSKVNGIPFTVPCITRANGEVRMIRPNPGEEEFMVFSPYLVHGGGKNFNDDLTRVSLEMRFFRALNPNSPTIS